MSLGRLHYIDDIRSIWKNEAKDFTPWLADNINLLGEELGLDLEVVTTEHAIGSFSLDVYAKDLGTSDFVAIENQIEVTDHSHLGQLITYASGIEAKTIIWISKEVREEHQKAIDWLNEISNEEIKFFAVEIQLIKIDDSDPAPLFKVKASPNEWSKEQKSRTIGAVNISEKQQYYQSFFTKVLQRVKSEMPNYTNSKSVSYDQWKSFPSGKSGYAYNLGFRAGDKFSCELYIDTGNKEENKERFDYLYQHKADIENKLGELSWERLDSKRACRIAAYIDVADDDKMIDWGINNLRKFKEIFSEYILNQ